MRPCAVGIGLRAPGQLARQHRHVARLRLLKQQLEHPVDVRLRGRLARVVDVGIGALDRVDDLQVGAGGGAHANEPLPNPHFFQRGGDIVPRFAAQKPRRHALAAQGADHLGDVNALAARVAPALADAVHLIEVEPLNDDRPVAGRIQRHCENHSYAAFHSSFPLNYSTKPARRKGLRRFFSYLTRSVRRYSVGVLPVYFRKARLKLTVLLKPDCVAAAVTLLLSLTISAMA